jgi:outer membrane protein OmpA-like peptidoglycan-associated protein
MKNLKTLFMTLVIAFVSITSINAQTAIQESKVFDNTYIGAEVGASTPLTFNSVFPLNAQAGIKVGKNFTPVFGMNVEGTALFGSAADNQSRFSYHNVVRATNVGLNATVDMFNLCLGYNPNRVFNLIPEVGIGWLHEFNNGQDFDNLSAKTGIQAAFNVKQTWQLYIEPVVLWNLTANNAVQFNKNHAQLGIQAGFIYKFKTSNGTHNFVTYNIGVMNDEISNLRAQLAQKPTEIVKEVPVVMETTKEVTKTIVLENATIFFAQNSYELSSRAKEALNNISTEAPVAVYGYASPEGTSEYNLSLSKKRADVVAQYLKNRGVNVSEVNGYGVDGIESNRVVLVIVK